MGRCTTTSTDQTSGPKIARQQPRAPTNLKKKRERQPRSDCPDGVLNMIHNSENVHSLNIIFEKTIKYQRCGLSRKKAKKELSKFREEMSLKQKEIAEKFANVKHILGRPERDEIETCVQNVEYAIYKLTVPVSMLSDEYANIEKKVKKDLHSFSRSLKDKNNKLKKCLKDFVSENYESEVNSDVDPDEERKDGTDGNESDESNGEEGNGKEKDDDVEEEEEEEEEKRKGLTDKKKTDKKSAKKKGTNPGSEEYQRNALESEETQPETVADTSEAPVSTPPSSQEPEKTQVQPPEGQIETTITIQSAAKTFPTDGGHGNNQITSAQLRNTEKSDNVFENQLPACSEQLKHMDILNEKKTEESIGLDQIVPSDEHVPSQSKGKTQETVSSQDETVIETPGSISSEEQIRVDQPKRSTEAAVVSSPSKKDIEPISPLEKPAEDILDVPENAKVDDIIVSDGPEEPNSEEHDAIVASSLEESVFDNVPVDSTDENVQSRSISDADILQPLVKQSAEQVPLPDKSGEFFQNAPEVNDVNVSDEWEEPDLTGYEYPIESEVEEDIGAGGNEDEEPHAVGDVERQHELLSSTNEKGRKRKAKEMVDNDPNSEGTTFQQSTATSSTGIPESATLKKRRGRSPKSSQRSEENNPEQVPLPVKSAEDSLHAPEDGFVAGDRLEEPDLGELADEEHVDSEVEDDIVARGIDGEEHVDSEVEENIAEGGIEEPQAVAQTEKAHSKKINLTELIVPQRDAAIKARTKQTEKVEPSILPTKKTPKKDTEKAAKKHDRWTEAKKYFTVAVLFALLKTSDQSPVIVENVRKKILDYAGLEEEQPETGEVEITEDDLLNTGSYRGLNSYCADKTNTVRDPIVLPDMDDEDDEAEITEDEKMKRRKVTRMKLESNWTVFELRFASALFIDPITSTGRQITDAVKKGVKKWKNIVYDTTSTFEFPEFPPDLVKREYEGTKERIQNKKRKDLDEDPWLHIPTPIINAEKHSEDMIKKLAQRPMACIRGLDKPSDMHGPGIILKNFWLNSKVGEYKTSIVEVHRQVTNALNMNWDLNSGKPKWKSQDVPYVEMKMKDFKKKYDEQTAPANKYLEDLENFKKEDFEKLMEELSDRNLFGANYHVPGDASETNPRSAKYFKGIWTEIGKMFKWLQPNNDGDLLKFTNVILSGINRAHLYFKTPTVRSSAHMENCGMASLNLNAGPDESMWYAVPFEFSRQMEKLVKVKCKETMFTPYWPLEEDIRKAGIPLQVYRQKQGDTIWLNPGTIHWVQSMGNSNHISWNLGLPTKSQLDIMAILHDQQKKTQKANKWVEAPNVAVQSMIWNLVKDKMKVEEGAEITVLHMFTKVLAYMQYELLVLKLLFETPKEWPEEKPDNWMATCKTCGIELFNIVARRGDRNYCIRHAYSVRNTLLPIFYQQHTIAEGEALHNQYLEEHADKFQIQQQ